MLRPMVSRPVWGLRPDIYYCQSVAGLFMWGAFSDERTGLSFTIAAGPRQRSNSQVRVPLDSWPYFTVSDSKLPFSPTPTPRKATVEVFNTASTRDWLQSDLGFLLYSVFYPRKLLLTTRTPYPWTLLFITQRLDGFQESISTETYFPTRSLAMGLHVTITWLGQNSILFLNSHEASTLAHDLNRIWFLECKFTLSNYDINNTRFVRLSVRSRQVDFVSSVSNSFFNNLKAYL
jgi:hypothetical protein